jgi:hypothetical protein
VVVVLVGKDANKRSSLQQLQEVAGQQEASVTERGLLVRCRQV